MPAPTQHAEHVRTEHHSLHGGPPLCTELWPPLHTHAEQPSIHCPFPSPLVLKETLSPSPLRKEGTAGNGEMSPDPGPCNCRCQPARLRAGHFSLAFSPSHRDLEIVPPLHKVGFVHLLCGMTEHPSTEYWHFCFLQSDTSTASSPVNQCFPSTRAI